MSQYLSSKITILNTILILMVVFIHSAYEEADEYIIASWIQRFIGQGVCRIANCMFFLISGYLLVRSVTSIKSLFFKQHRRIRTLVIPYVLWNIIFILWYVILNEIPIISSHINNSIIASFKDKNLIDTISIIFFKPAAFQLWFLRDLIFMTIISPIIYLLTKFNVYISILLCLLCICIYSWITYFWIGMIIAVSNIDIEKRVKTVPYVIFSSILFLFSCIIIASFNIEYTHTAIRYMMFICNLMGIYSIWRIYDAITNYNVYLDRGIWKYICGFSFFIYCFHEPTFNILKKSTLIMFGVNEYSLIISYLVNPLIMFFISIILAKLIQNLIPRFYMVLTGGR